MRRAARAALLDQAELLHERLDLAEIFLDEDLALLVIHLLDAGVGLRAERLPLRRVERLLHRLVERRNDRAGHLRGSDDAAPVRQVDVVAELRGRWYIGEIRMALGAEDDQRHVLLGL